MKIGTVRELAFVPLLDARSSYRLELVPASPRRRPRGRPLPAVQASPDPHRRSLHRSRQADQSKPAQDVD